MKKTIEQQLKEARRIALIVLAETERELQEERSTEARFLLSTWESPYTESPESREAEGEGVTTV